MFFVIVEDDGKTLAGFNIMVGSAPLTHLVITFGRHGRREQRRRTVSDSFGARVACTAPRVAQALRRGFVFLTSKHCMPHLWPRRH